MPKINGIISKEYDRKGLLNMKAIKQVTIATLCLLTALWLSGCSGLGTLSEKGQTLSVDGVSSATKTTDSQTEIKNIWQTLDDNQVKQLFEDNTLRGVFLWSNSKENLVVADPQGIDLPFTWPEAQNAVSLKNLGYPLVTASPKALVDADPNFILLMLPKAEEDRLETVKEELKKTLSGRALAKVTRDHFYLWLYEPKSK